MSTFLIEILSVSYKSDFNGLNSGRIKCLSFNKSGTQKPLVILWLSEV